MEKTIDLQEIQTNLEDLRQRLLRRIRKQAKKIERPTVSESDSSALAQRYVTHQRRSSAQIRAERKLEQVVAALQRLDQGNYGICLTCGQAIQPGRLATLPYAELCVQCKETQETQGITI